MILYFSGTGNSSYTAKTIKSVIGDEILSINDIMKRESKETIKSNKPFVFVCPTYAWRIPRVVEEFIKETKFLGEKDVYFIMTCGGDTGNAINYIKDLCMKKGFNLKGFASLKMPDNYITMYNTPKREEADEMIEASTKIVTSLAEDIKVGKSFIEKEISLGDKLKSGIVNSLFYSAFVSAKGFKYTEECISCGKCVKLCPLNNIELVKGKPNWGDKCTHCMACISRCPKEAIEYKNKTKGRNRYYLEN